MDINKISSYIKEKVSDSNSTSRSQKSDEVNYQNKKKAFEDKVTIEKYNHRNERLFAQIELEKLQQKSVGRLKAYKTKLSEYQEAKTKSDELAKETEIGKKVNNPDIWNEIAQKIISE